MSNTTDTVILDAKATAKFREQEETTRDVAPCNTCGNDWTAYNCTCDAPTWEHFDY